MEKNIIFVKNFETICFIGIYPEEKSKKQKVNISVKLEFKRTGYSDKLSNTMSYEIIIDYLKNIKNLQHINLVETLANKICNFFQSQKNICYIEIEIIKCNLLNKKTDVGFVLQKTIKV